MKIQVLLLTILSTALGQLTPGILEINPNVTGNKYIFTLGGCDDECGCGAGCCDPNALLEAQEQYVDILAANVGVNSGVTSPLNIGFGPDFQKSTLQNCDHMSNATFIFAEPFKYNGDLLSMAFEVHSTCGDAWNIARGYDTHKLFRVGLFKKSGPDGTCKFALQSYIDFDRTNPAFSAWNNALISGSSYRFTYTFTDADLANLSIKNKMIKDLHIGVQMYVVGTIGYQKWDNSFTGNPMCIGDMGQLNDPAVLNNYNEVFPNFKQQNRRYNAWFTYQPW